MTKPSSSKPAFDRSTEHDDTTLSFGSGHKATLFDVDESYLVHYSVQDITTSSGEPADIEFEVYLADLGCHHYPAVVFVVLCPVLCPKGPKKDFATPPELLLQDRRWPDGSSREDVLRIVLDEYLAKRGLSQAQSTTPAN